MESQDLINKIKQNNLQSVFFNLTDKGEFLENTNFETEKELNEALAEFGEMESVFSVCNSDEMKEVIHFKTHNIYLKLTGEYDSYGNYEHDYDCGIKQVTPKEITTTIYE